MTGVTIRRIGGLTQRLPVQHNSTITTYQVEVGGEVYAQVSRYANGHDLVPDIRHLVRYAMRWRRSVHGPLHLATSREGTR